jgi:hypothetical protein
MSAHHNPRGPRSRAVLRAAPAGAATLAGVARQSQPAAPAAPDPLERWLLVLAAVAAWSIVPPYLGPLVGLDLDVPSTTEIVDHVIPGVCAVAAALLARVHVRRGASDSIQVLAALGVCTLAGLFETASHATLVLDAGGPLQPVETVILHASVGPALMLLSLWLFVAPPTAKSAA